MSLKTLEYPNNRPRIVDASFVPTDLIDANVHLLMNRKMNMFLHANAMHAVCNLRGQVVARFKPSHLVNGDFGPEAA